MVNLGVFRFFFQHWKVFSEMWFHGENISIWEWQNLHSPFLSTHSRVIVQLWLSIMTPSVPFSRSRSSYHIIRSQPVAFRENGVCNHTHIKRQIEADPLIQRLSNIMSMPTQKQTTLPQTVTTATDHRPPTVHSHNSLIHACNQTEIPRWCPIHELDKQLQNPHWHWSDGNTSILHQNDLLQTNSDVTISKSHDTIISRYEVHDTIFIAKFTKKTNWELEKKLCFVHFKVKLFYLMHFESSKWRAPTHVLN